MSNIDLLDAEEVGRFFGGSKPLSVPTVYRWVRAGRIPNPVRIGPSQSRWLRNECQEALQAMIDASKPQEPQQ